MPPMYFTCHRRVLEALRSLMMSLVSNCNSIESIDISIDTAVGLLSLSIMSWARAKRITIIYIYISGSILSSAVDIYHVYLAPILVTSSR